MRVAERMLVGVSKLFFGVTAAPLFLLVAVAVQGTWSALPGSESLPQILRSIGLLLTIAVAEFEVAKFLLEEELIRERELRSIIDVR